MVLDALPFFKKVSLTHCLIKSNKILCFCHFRQSDFSLAATSVKSKYQFHEGGPAFVGPSVEVTKAYLKDLVFVKTVKVLRKHIFDHRLSKVVEHLK